jgi:hypothetical protein
MYYLASKHLFVTIESENLFAQGINHRKPTNLHREVECHKLNNWLETMVSSTNSNASKTSLLDM